MDGSSDFYRFRKLRRHRRSLREFKEAPAATALKHILHMADKFEKSVAEKAGLKPEKGGMFMRNLGRILRARGSDASDSAPPEAKKKKAKKAKKKAKKDETLLTDLRGPSSELKSLSLRKCCSAQAFVSEGLRG